MNNSAKIDREKRMVELMIRLYCRRKERNAQLCPECAALIEYAHARLDRCPDGENKQSRKQCHRHCYNANMREKIRYVMRFSGPRMLLYSPMEFLRHLFG